MKFSKKWLLERANLSISSKKICSQMTQAGLESEILTDELNKFKKIIVGKIISYHLHPKSKTLKVIKVKIEKKRIIQIISNAKNCRVGIKVAVATKSSVILKDKKVFSKVILGELSEGILCSFQELGMIDNQINNVIELPSFALIGRTVKEYFYPNDTTIVVNLPSNRSDILGIIGIAREMSVLNGLSFAKFEKKKVIPKIKDVGKVKILTHKEFPKYVGRIIKNIDLQVDTPFWIKERLRFCQVSLEENVINNIINYVLIEFNQPLHVFNWNYNNSNLIFRYSKKNELVKLENGESFFLDEKIIVGTCKNSKIIFIPLGLNLKNGRISFSSKNILLCSVFLTPSYAKNFSNQKWVSFKMLETYKRGMDFSFQNYVLEYATELILNICGGLPGPILNKKTFSNYFKRKKILFNFKKIKKILGYEIDIFRIEKILVLLGFEIIKCKKNIWEITIPTWRNDISLEEDIISEVIRVVGCDKIKSIPIKSKIIIGKKNKITSSLKEIKSMFFYKGYNEVINYSFVNPSQQKIFFKDKELISLLNPISIEMSSMRSTLLVGLLNNISYNQSRQETSIRLFEIGLCFSLEEKKKYEVNQELFIAGVISGKLTEKHWNIKDRKFNFFDLKDDVETMLSLTRHHSNIFFSPKVFFGLHSHQSAEILLNNQSIGKIGTLDPILIKKFNLKESVFLFEISMEKLFPFNNFSVKDISIFPGSKKDISFLVSNKVLSIDIIKECESVSPGNIKKVSLIDMYTDKKFLKGTKGISISLFFQNQYKTLEESEILQLVEKCISQLRKKFNIILRNE
ncbi:phenylalanine--tRNA ligase subunit beta [Buchnera aphidicola]|uniref:phenylalanine--tRNA ligase subunit beta n=1 Tax=Buchnera aphidicola TaxID=9 RepID=UPI0031B817B0